MADLTERGQALGKGMHGDEGLTGMMVIFDSRRKTEVPRGVLFYRRGKRINRFGHGVAALPRARAATTRHPDELRNDAKPATLAVSLDPTNSYFNLIKLDPACPNGFTNMANHHISGLTVQSGDTFQMVFTTSGSLLTGVLCNSAGVALDTIVVNDASYTSGVSGTWAWKKSGSIEGSWSNLSLTAAPVGLSGPDTAVEGSPYTLMIGGLVDPGGDAITGYTVRWGDGSASKTLTVAQLAEMRYQVSHTYLNAAAARNITVGVADGDGAYTALASRSVTVIPRAFAALQQHALTATPALTEASVFEQSVDGRDLHVEAVAEDAVT